MSTRVQESFATLWRSTGLALLLLAPAPAHSEALPELDCVTTPRQVVEVSSAVAGLLTEVRVERGDTVARGEPVAQLESSVEQATVKVARTRAAMTGELRSQQVNLEFGGRKSERADNLYRKHAVAFELKEDADRDAALAAAGVQHAREKRELAALELRRAQALLERRTVRSPLDGIVTERYRSPGEYVEDQAIIRLAQLHPLRVELLAPVTLAGRIHPGMRALVTPEVGADTALEATVTVVDRVADAASGMFGVRLELPNPEHALMAGLKCQVSFLEGTAPAPVPPQRQPEPARELPEPDLVVPQAEDAPTPEPDLVDTTPAPTPPARSVALETAPKLASAPNSASPRVSVATPTDTSTAATPSLGIDTTLALEAVAQAPDASAPSLDHSDGLHITPDTRLPAQTLSVRSAPAPQCASLGPLKDAEQAQAIATALTDSDLQVHKREVPAVTPSSFIVVAGTGASARDGQTLAQALRRSGITDLHLMLRGEHRYRVSLGVYRQRVNAEHRQSELRAKGFDTELRARGNTHTRWWLDLELANSDAGREALAQRVAAIDPSLTPEPKACLTRVAVVNNSTPP